MFHKVILLTLALSLVRRKRSWFTVYLMAVPSFLSARKINDTAMTAFLGGWNSYSPNDEGIRTVIVSDPFLVSWRYLHKES